MFYTSKMKSQPDGIRTQIIQDIRESLVSGNKEPHNTVIALQWRATRVEIGNYFLQSPVDGYKVWGLKACSTT